MSNKHFKGNVELYQESLYIDTETGEGADSFIKKIEPLLCKMSSGTYIKNYQFEDTKQELAIMALDGLRKYDSTRGVKLSTFMHIHLRNKLISLLTNKNKASNDACAYIRDKYESKADGPVAKIKRVKEELPFSAYNSAMADLNGRQAIESGIAEEDGSPYSNCTPYRKDYESINFEMTIKKLSKGLDRKTSKIIELVYFEDYSIKEAAQVVGLSNWGASLRLKKLANKKSFKDAFIDIKI